VFCSTQAHALAVRDLINQNKSSSEPNYCVRVTANDGKKGEELLRVFQDNEKTIPTILTSSKKLSTGVDARNIRNIVLMRPVNSLIEFKQIIGRGTRLFEGKDYFTIYDFVKAYEHFNDPEWDGDPEAPDPCIRCGNEPCTCLVSPPSVCKVCNNTPCECVKEPFSCPRCEETPCICKKVVVTKVKLADGKERNIQHMSATTFWSPDGKPISASQFIKGLFGELPVLFGDEDQLRSIWGRPDTRKSLLHGLEEKGYGREQLHEVRKLIDAEASDLFDVLAYIAFALPTITRQQRVESHRDQIYQHCSESQQEFLEFILEHYISEGVEELEQEKLPELLQLKYHSIPDAVQELGAVKEIRELFIGFQGYLYSQTNEVKRLGE